MATQLKEPSRAIQFQTREACADAVAQVVRTAAGNAVSVGVFIGDQHRAHWSRGQANSQVVTYLLLAGETVDCKLLTFMRRGALPKAAVAPVYRELHRFAHEPPPLVIQPQQGDAQVVPLRGIQDFVTHASLSEAAHEACRGPSPRPFVLARVTTATTAGPAQATGREFQHFFDATTIAPWLDRGGTDPFNGLPVMAQGVESFGVVPADSPDAAYVVHPLGSRADYVTDLLSPRAAALHLYFRAAQGDAAAAQYLRLMHRIGFGVREDPPSSAFFGRVARAHCAGTAYQNATLGLAARYGHVPIIEALCGDAELPVGLDALSAEDRTPLMVAASHGHAAAARALLAAGADVMRLSRSGHWASHCAVMQGHADVAALLFGAEQQQQQQQQAAADSLHQL